MKRFIVSLVVVVGALLSACTEEEDSLPTAGLSGTFDVALVAGEQLSDSEKEPDLLFVTSADRNELRVLELTTDATSRGYVRAPNPLEPLSIPVLPRPQVLTRDTRYDNGGTGVDVGGSYLYARSNGSAVISVVATGRPFLREVLRLNDPSLPPEEQVLFSTGPVTAFAARGSEDGSSTLYYATREVTGAQLWEVRVPAPQALIDGTGTVQGGALGVTLPENVVVSSLIVMPASGQLALTTRGPVGTTGRSYKVTLPNTLMELNFGGSQVLQLATHGQVLDPADSTRELLAAGQRIFGVLDPASCGGVRFPCPSGVLAVESATGTVSKDLSARDASNNPSAVHEMLPITGTGLGVPMGLTLSANTDVTLNGRLSLAGIVPLSNGETLVFDALGLLQLDMGEGAAAGTTAFLTPSSSQEITGDISVEVTEGVTTNETYQLTYQGILPGLGSLERNGQTTTFVVPYETRPGKGPVVQAGDFIVLLSASSQVCSDLVVDAVQPPVPPATNAILTTSTPIPADCTDYPRFLVRAGGEQPLVLASSTEDYLARLGTSDSYTRTLPYSFHPGGYTGASEGKAVVITVSSRLTEVTPQRGNAYVVTTRSNFFPFSITVDTSIQELAFFTLPGPVVAAKVGTIDYAYIAYPSADGILQVDLEQVSPFLANSRAVFPFQ